MYLKLTTRCNMSCPHCCNSCGPRGRDMSPEVFTQALALARDRGEGVLLGGGEPTLHPRFREMLIEALVWSRPDYEETVYCITNGTDADMTLFMLKMAAAGDNPLMGCEVSDPYDGLHEPDKVPARVHAYLQELQPGTVRRRGWSHWTRNVGQGLLPVGRAARNRKRLEAEGFRFQDETRESPNCVCQELVVDPCGALRGCGCPRAIVVGHVSTGIDPQWQGAGYGEYCSRDRLWATNGEPEKEVS